jgi:hypothetical protein
MMENHRTHDSTSAINDEDVPVIRYTAELRIGTDRGLVSCGPMSVRASSPKDALLGFVQLIDRAKISHMSGQDEIIIRLGREY